MQQRSPEWYAARCGKVTASRVAELMAKTKSGWSASRANYMAELICERITGAVAESYVNGAMQWGIDTEPQARAVYELTHNIDVVAVGFADHATVPMFGASPDGLVGDDGMLEIKCPNTATHINTLLEGGIDGKYHIQMQAQMACARRSWCDFVSFDPRMPAEMQLWSFRVARDGPFIAAMETAVMAFLGELDQKVEELRLRYQQVAA